MAYSDQEQITLPPELAQIHAEAIQLEPQPAANQEQAAPGAAPLPVIDYYSDAADLTSMIFEGCGAIYPSTGPVLQPKQARFAAALGKVMEKRQWSLAGILGRWGAEIELGFVASSMAIPLLHAIQADRAAAKLAEQTAEIVSRPADPQPERPAGDPYSRLAEQQATQ